MFSEKIDSLQGLEKAAINLLAAFPSQRVFAFYGEIGAGKTTFIQYICKLFGSDDIVTSPTFAIINEYKTIGQKLIFHFDFYRIKSLEEAFDLGYEDYLFGNDYCLIEWPEMIEPLLPEKFVEVKIEVNPDQSRIISARLVNHI
ncbi:MAG: tRNA (adenosine(37)-N6)-threonylcarbamoyltransferase complex ATPase subunit type 1 TsaE [Bacteroidales bacterium]|jgi:tRNA threonylcarbamoyladenosine biosynthesis protein TsaE|nr:tRNA (adenosine(37)-N6)-threonylcarbamoyltransferase complex ATPase subunit type 1 TsaE [Bacteroidales bacterium]